MLGEFGCGESDGIFGFSGSEAGARNGIPLEKTPVLGLKNRE
jgi:hypothetical protein